MNLQGLLDFSNYLSVAPRSFDEIAKHISLFTFGSESFQMTCMGMLEPDGSIQEVGHFGEITCGSESPVVIPFEAGSPIHKALKISRALVAYNTDQLGGMSADSIAFPAPSKWQTLLIIPIDDLGVIAIYFRNRVEESPIQQLLWQTLGSIIGLYISSNRRSEVSVETNNHDKIPDSDSKMSERQAVILKMIERGLSNPQIARELGYSESLIRQETVHIFRKLNVSGRKEILSNSNGVPDMANKLRDNPSTQG